MKSLTLFKHLQENYKDYLYEKALPIISKHNESLLNPCSVAVSIYRIQRQLFKKHRNNEKFQELQKILSMIQRVFCNCEIYYTAEIGNNFLLVHAFGTVIGSGVKIGNNCTIYHNVTLGTKYDTDKNKCKIEDNVIIYAGAKVLGDIVIEENSVIAANSVIIKSVPNNQVWGGIPGKKINNNISPKYKL